MDVYEINPTSDARWEDFLEAHPQASIFHTRGWLEALRRTYGYTPVAFTTSPPGSPLTNGIPFCKITGWLGKQRLVALPFSDHCVPLVEKREQLAHLLEYLRQKLDKEAWSYIQIRSNDAVVADPRALENNGVLVLHKLDLRPALSEIVRRFHPSCVQRKIRRARHERLTSRRGTSSALVNTFYELLVRTRRRHGLPPQPTKWFRNIIGCLGDNTTIHVAYKGSLPVASILTLRFKDTLVYKYGCSDDRFNHLGGMQLLLWESIQGAKNENLSELDMGRSESENQGLVTFKTRWGASASALQYLRYSLQHPSPRLNAAPGKLSRLVCSHLPGSLLIAAGRLLYRYEG